MLFGALVALTAFTSCSESSEDAMVEYADWQDKNETYFDGVYARAKSAVESGDSKWKILTKWSVNEEVAAVTDHVVVEVLETGSGSESPLFTDKVFAYYLGRLIPSASYSEGFVFDKSFQGEALNTDLSSASYFQVSTLTDGFSTALQQMHVGDYWRVYVPYQLGYGVLGQGSIPGYSTLVFDIRLHSFYHAGSTDPEWTAKPFVTSAEE